ncbi:MAG: bifunctional phosphopantothenoylcysteine decarboxylase/phosphopantothenate--cysteine ligase CoaBC [Flavobacteriales bacterium]|nr:bifunctional phosphopantothenoylcysteine decarboxylase/phosphopantothenate--cysteine ligase CoaBC [Flavobacteriales bacterium]
MVIEGKKILVAVTGSIAAYKSAFLIRLLLQAGAQVKVVMSKAAIDFITPLTLSTLSKNPVHSDFTENPDAGLWTNHVEFGTWADLMVVAPLSANTLSKMATGQCDNFLMAVYMSARCPIMLAPAMDHDMMIHTATTENIEKLKSFGHQILSPGYGELASGLVGKGRMAEPEEIFQEVVSFFNPELPLKGKKVLVTAGPTYEMIDPVRFIGNFSSGKMGFEIGRALADCGASVQLVSGPVSQFIQHSHIKIHKVTSADEMAEVCEKIFPETDIAVLAAAVADFKPKNKATSKIKKSLKALSLNLEATTDIAAKLGKQKRPDQLLIGFALETDNEQENATKKLVAKNFDMIVLNSLNDEGAGFGTDTNKITLIWPNNKTMNFGLKPKKQVAKDIVSEIIKLTSK